MRAEVNPSVLSWLDNEYIAQKRPTLTTLLERLAIEVTNEKDTLYAWSWRRGHPYTPRHIITIWSEDIVISPDGHWEVPVLLEPSDNPYFNEDQRRREIERISILKEMHNQGVGCRAILMINRFSREDHNVKGIAAQAELRVQDTHEQWHIEDRGTFPQMVLTRGSRPEKKQGPPRDEEDPIDDEEPSLHFPDPETRKRVEVAAIGFAKKSYEREGEVTSVEADKCGYDLKVTDRVTGEIKLKVEVKGTSSDVEQFYLTRNEYREAKADPKRWRLAMVVDALGNPDLQEYRLAEMERLFEMQPLVWHCRIAPDN